MMASLRGLDQPVLAGLEQPVLAGLEQLVLAGLEQQVLECLEQHMLADLGVCCAGRYWSRPDNSIMAAVRGHRW